MNSTWKVAVSFKVIMTKSIMTLWQDRVSQHNVRPARPRPRPQRTTIL